jgi:hydroxyacyl-ACP dehydratase HTD2-like protein with hotdog domain
MNLSSRVPQLNNLCQRCLQTASFSTSRRTQQADPRGIADAFISKFASGQTFVRKQFIDANQLRLFSLTLHRPHLWPGSANLENEEPPEGTPVPPAYHWAYFTPAQLQHRLGLDGTDASFNPDSPFTRRMWAGGSVHWPGADPSQAQRHYLKVGDTATEITKLLSCEPKAIKKTGESMLVVGVEKEFRDSKDNLCIVDRRNWVFREALDPSKPASSPTKPAELSQSDLDKRDEGKAFKEINRDEVQLFRMSALTFNAHRIHYDKPWATQVEGHRNAVVHGPLSLLAMIDLWRDEKSGEGISFPKQVEYRATSPVYAGEAHRAVLSGKGSEVEVQVLSNDGKACMKGKVTEW